jgi:hypothetical protein
LTTTNSAFLKWQCIFSLRVYFFLSYITDKTFTGPDCMINPAAGVLLLKRQLLTLLEHMGLFSLFFSWGPCWTRFLCCVLCFVTCMPNFIDVWNCWTFRWTSGCLHLIRLLTEFVCLYTYEFWLSLCKIVRSSVILLLPLLDVQMNRVFTFN